MKKKLAISISAVVVIGMSVVLSISTTLGLKYAKADAEEMNQKTAASLSLLVRQFIEINNTRARSWVVQSSSQEALEKLIEGDSSILGIKVLDSQSGATDLSAFQLAIKNSKNDSRIDASDVAALNGSSELIYRDQLIGSTRTHLMISPLVIESGVVKKILGVFLDPSALSSLFKSTSFEEKFMFNAQGQVLMRGPSIQEGYFEGELMPKNVISLTNELKSSSTGNTQRLVDNEKMKGASSKFYVGIFDTKAGVFVAVSTPQNKIFEKVELIAWQSAFLGLALLSLALWFAFFFSDSIVKPLLSLVEATKLVSQGNFNIRTQATTQDELAVLANAFNEMTLGLAEREKIKEVFGKFHSKAVIQKLFEEDRINLGGERISVTVFFSDIRSFTNSSEKMSPEHVVEMLNEYMGEMVGVIEEFKGVVDKYVGDAIMAVWGMPTAEPSQDAERSVLACLKMREKLLQLNHRRQERGDPPIEIGMGLNSGEVIAGNIGSPSRMEYTVIGDTVNTASRMESSTKNFKTDFLINSSTVALLPRSEIFILEGPFEAEAKGKAGKMAVYQCKGLKEGFHYLLDASDRVESLHINDISTSTKAA